MKNYCRELNNADKAWVESPFISRKCYAELRQSYLPYKYLYLYGVSFIAECEKPFPIQRYK